MSLMCLRTEKSDIEVNCHVQEQLLGNTYSNKPINHMSLDYRAFNDQTTTKAKS
jgi:hypothetical protein